MTSIVDMLSEKSDHNLLYLSELSNIKDSIGVSIPTSVIQKGYKKLNHAYPIKDSISYYKTVVQINSRFLKTEIEKAILARCNNEEAFDDIIEYFGASLKNKEIEKLGDKLVGNFKKDQNTVSALALTRQIAKIFKETNNIESDYLLQ